MMHLRREALPWRPVDDEIVALDARSSRYLGANPSGAVLWERLAEGATEDDLVDALVAAYPEARERAAGDVRAFVSDLRARGLVEDR